MNKTVKIEYPSWRYHPTLPAMVIKNEFEEPDVEEGWRDVPYPQTPKVQTGTVQSPNSTPAPPCQECARKDKEFKQKEESFDRAWGELSLSREALQKRYDTLVSEFKAMSAVPPKPPKEPKAKQVEAEVSPVTTGA